jgi:putative ABC transport system permease protein
MFKLALRNVFRHRIRTAITLAAIVVGVLGLILSGGFVQDLFVQFGEALIHSRSGHLQVLRAGYFESGIRSPERFLIEDPAPLREEIAAMPQVKEVMARMTFSGLVNSGRADWAIVGEGIEPDKEARLGSHLHIVAGRQITDRDRNGILVGQGVALALKLAPGDRVTLLANTSDGALNSLDLELVGVFQSFSKDFDARAIRIPYAAAQDLLFTRGANSLVVSLRDTGDTDRVATVLAKTFEGRPVEIRNWRELNDFYEKTVALYERQFGVLQGIILVMVLLSVANSVNMNVFERTGEFGTMMALGSRRRHVFLLIVTESAMLGAFGAALGAVVGVALAKAISAFGIPMPPPPNANLGYTAYIRVVPEVVATAAAVGISATTLAALLPARRLARRPVLEALRAGR